ncbi:hypothetical protein [Acanthopleuribacter pedis]|uniref:Uncharacterized protein n=1 Tax=Acanthopleuribacter pedis TaxID=442870 RepID=A0A8J7U699_9BACT|nr:hypothetical protein [Acanthopleuribacter pedis]MBO1323388.1 hypothetical protein [Acanthopleuribacter pedis]
METLSLEQAWATVVPTWKRQAQQLSRLPIYRNWKQPAADALRGTRLSGLTVFFLDAHRSWLSSMALGSDLENLGLTTGRAAFGHRAVFYGPENVRFIPVFRETDIAGGLNATVPGDPIPTSSYGAFLTGLGYQIRMGSKLQLAGRLLTLPNNLDPHDAVAETVRVVCHREWARRDGAGYLGAEMLFGLVCPELGLDSSNLRTTKPLQEEIARSRPASFVSQSLVAAVMAGQLLGEALGNTRRMLFFDAMAQPSEITPPPSDFIELEDFFS